MLTVFAKDYGVVPGCDVTKEWNALLIDIAKKDGQKTVIVESGEYFLSAALAEKPTLFITNTMADSEWKKGETYHENCVATLMEGVSDLTLEGNGAIFVIRGQMTNMAIRNCSHVNIKSLIFRTENPNMHGLTVMKRGRFFIDFALDHESYYQKSKGKLYFTGEDYRDAFTKDRARAFWTGKIPYSNVDSVWRVAHPLLGALTIKEISPYAFRARYIVPPRVEKGDSFWIFDARRKYNGIFVERSDNITLNGIEQNFNYGLAVVCQDTRNFTVKNCTFRPKQGGDKKMASVADFMQICMCRGLVEIVNNHFEGSGDDCLNVHGIHFKIVKAEGKLLHAQFCHPQTLGFCPFYKGDIIKYINPKTLLEEDRNTVEDARLVDEYTVELQLKNPIEKTLTGKVIENQSACPDVLFENNTMKRIITRGVLLTTSGKAVIRGNKFINTSMHSILISDDAKNWYESGNVNDVLIENNVFLRCMGYTVQVIPENSMHAGAVHKNIKIINNVIDRNGEGGFYFKSASGVTVKNNTVKGAVRKTYIKDSDVKIDG